MSMKKQGTSEVEINLSSGLHSLSELVPRKSESWTMVIFLFLFFFFFFWNPMVFGGTPCSARYLTGYWCNDSNQMDRYCLWAHFTKEWSNSTNISCDERERWKQILVCKVLKAESRKICRYTDGQWPQMTSLKPTTFHLLRVAYYRPNICVI